MNFYFKKLYCFNLKYNKNLVLELLWFICLFLPIKDIKNYGNFIRKNLTFYKVKSGS